MELSNGRKKEPSRASALNNKAAVRQYADSSGLAQARLQGTTNSKTLINNGNYKTEVTTLSKNKNPKEDTLPVSRQNRVTVNSSYRSKPNHDSKDPFQN